MVRSELSAGKSSSLWRAKIMRSHPGLLLFFLFKLVNLHCMIIFLFCYWDSDLDLCSQLYGLDLNVHTFVFIRRISLEIPL